MLAAPLGDRNAKEAACQVHFTADASCGPSCADCTAGAHLRATTSTLSVLIQMQNRQVVCTMVSTQWQPKF